MDLVLLHGSGPIAQQEAALMINATLLMLIVVIPVILLLFYFAWQYRAGNKKAVYMPNWEHGRIDELIWWAVPLEIVLVLSAITYSSTHALDPHKELSEASSTPPLVVQVVALDWKWLFIYPDLHIATVNYLPLPEGVPVDFEVTADAPMNSFWIPALGGQIYAMTGMVNPLHLLASETGDFKGLSANYSGEHFADMQFVAHVVSPNDFNTWVAQAQQASSSAPLTWSEYKTLAQPEVEVPGYYGSVAAGLFDSIVGQFESH